jgi:threonine/homoserine/homoserine lactone efflux protein
MKVFKNGLLTGLALQMAIGPVFFFIINLTLQKTILDGFAGVIGVTLADYFYITLAIVGVGKLLEHQRVKKIFGVISSIVLTIFGLMIIKGATNMNLSTSAVINSANVFSSLISVLLLTLSSPLTIVMWTSLFATKTLEHNYTKKELFVFGLSTGLATFMFMGATVILFSLVRGTIPIILIQILNVVVGCLLVGYGVLRLIKTVKK